MSAEQVNPAHERTPDTPASDVTGCATGTSGGEVAPGATGDAEGGKPWTCTKCGWQEMPHPTYGWQQHNQRAVEVHQTMLCSVLDEDADGGQR